MAPAYVNLLVGIGQLPCNIDKYILRHGIVINLCPRNFRQAEQTEAVIKSAERK
jgi:DNA recombination-dependent growth factor C